MKKCYLFHGLNIGVIVFSTIFFSDLSLAKGILLNTDQRQSEQKKVSNSSRVKRPKKGKIKKQENFYKFCMNNPDLIDFRAIANEFRPKHIHDQYMSYQPTFGNKNVNDQEDVLVEEFQESNQTLINESTQHLNIEPAEMREVILESILSDFREVKDLELEDLEVRENLCRQYQTLVNIESNESI